MTGGLTTATITSSHKITLPPHIKETEIDTLQQRLTSFTDQNINKLFRLLKNNEPLHFLEITKTIHQFFK